MINTHFHFDHAHGNQVYPGDVEIIGHEFTHEVMARGDSKRGRSYESYIGTIPDRIAELERRLVEAEDDSVRTALEGQLAYQRNYLAATDAVVHTPPTVTLSERLTLFPGGREIRVVFFGRGHTGGDVVVHLPAERVLVTGDRFNAGIPYLGDGFLLEWAETLERLKPLDFDVVVPGHGRAFDDRAKLDHLQAYLRDLWTKAVEMYEAGVDAEEAATRIDMRNHADHYPNITAAGVNPHAVLRVYDLLDERAASR